MLFQFDFWIYGPHTDAWRVGVGNIIVPVSKQYIWVVYSGSATVPIDFLRL